MFQTKVRKFEYCREFDRKIQQKNVKKKKSIRKSRLTKNFTNMIKLNNSPILESVEKN